MAVDPPRNKLLAQVKKGMQVVDSNGDEVGTVSFVHMADLNDPDDTPARRDDDAVPLLNLVQGDDDDGSLIDVLTGDDDDVTERMVRSGYVKIDASGIFAGDKYVVPHQIASVEGNQVFLNVGKDDVRHPD